MVVAFVGIHVPLLTLLVSFLVSSTFPMGLTVRVLIIGLCATLAGTICTLYALRDLLAPVVLTAKSLRDYANLRALPNLPTEFSDEVGLLMSNTSRTIQQLDQVIHYMASYDDLTGLPNQTLLSSRLQQRLSHAQQKHQFFAVSSFAIGNLDAVYSAFGKESSESFVRAVAQRLSLQFHESVLFSYLGGGLFTAVQTHSEESTNRAVLAQTILEALQEPFMLDEQEIYAVVNIGTSVYPYDSTEINQLLQHANAALNQAKQLGRNTHQFFASEMNVKLQERLSLENELRCALARNELQLHYQPRVETQSGRIVAVEALLRWHSPTRGWVSPGTFIPIAEDSGLILSLGTWILKTACRQNRLWQEAGLPPIRMAVNLSVHQLRQDNFGALVGDILAETQLDAASLELEVTESLMMDNMQQSIDTLQALGDRGITLALDDFGTGYSSLSYLRRFPIDTLKIDQSFVQNVLSDVGDAAITKTIIALAQNLQLNITAEGVETQEQFEFIKSQGCDEVQGFYFSRPILADHLTDLLQNGANLSKQSAPMS
ncbi:putative bifunctional diguanylate cyclase/phosphodiesterase [Acaryochloris thomasi]|nr:bifunctional diguanylate cyclase/phosphodiesterase [Acaryochloris thomasi]